MRRLIAGVMAVGVLGCGVQVFRGEAPLPLRLAAFTVLFAPIALAAARIVPDAVRLGSRSDPVDVQSALARGICRSHLVCFAGIAAFVALQIWA